RHGPIATLRLQSEHRQHDMLTDPERMLADVGQMIQALQPDICIVDQLSYAVTLALYCLQQPFLTYCPGHPTYVPSGTQLFGVPYAWPREFTIAPEALSDLRHWRSRSIQSSPVCSIVSSRPTPRTCPLS
ncbi:MAG: hypothetical protein HC893_09325, partial [Chloroflexaceae bacterium]|nr:hypothetical protein [Chloroflexaceae bacterium]